MLRQGGDALCRRHWLKCSPRVVADTVNADAVQRHDQRNGFCPALLGDAGWRAGAVDPAAAPCELPARVSAAAAGDGAGADRGGAGSLHPGVSTRSVDALVRAAGMTGISSSQVSRLWEAIDERVSAFLERPLEGGLAVPVAGCHLRQGPRRRAGGLQGLRAGRGGRSRLD